MEPLLKAENVNKVYKVGAKTLRVLKDVCLDVLAGEALAIIGPSGAGKTTLLHTLGGLDRPTSGTVLLKGQDVYRQSDGRRTGIRAAQIGFVFQSYHLLPELDVIENVLLPAMTGIGTMRLGIEARRRALDLLKAVGLEDRAAHTPMELSGGEQQRVALARSMMNQPEIILADEPTGNLDSATGSQVLGCLWKMVKEKGCTLVLVTHNERITASCDRVVRLVDGAIQNAQAQPGASFIRTATS